MTWHKNGYCAYITYIIRLSVLDVIQSVNMAFSVRRVKMYVSDLPHILSGSGIMARGTFDR